MLNEKFFIGNISSIFNVIDKKIIIYIMSLVLFNYYIMFSRLTFAIQIILSSE